MSRLREIVLRIRTSSGKHDLSCFTSEKWADVEANIEKEFPDDGPAFTYKNNDGDDAAVFSDDTLKRFVQQIADRVEESDRKATVQVKLVSIRDAQGHAARARAGATGASKDDKTPKATPITFPSTSESYVIYKPVSSWASENVTVAMFVRCAVAGNQGALFSYASRSHINELALFHPRSLKLYIKQTVLETNVALEEGQWYHVAITWSQDGEVHLFLNGDDAFTARKHRVGAKLDAGGAFVLGDQQESFGSTARGENSFAGDIALVSVWKVALKREAIRAMALQAAVKGSESGLCLLWDFARVSGMVVADGLDPEDGRKTGQLKEGAVVASGPVPVRGSGQGGQQGGSGWQGKRLRGQVLRFEEGSSGRVQMEPPADLLQEEVTVMLWVCSADTLGRGSVLSWAGAHPEAGLVLVQVRDCADLAITVGGAESEVRTHTSVADGAWHHVAVTWKRAAGKVVLMVDGEERFTGEVGDVELGRCTEACVMVGQQQWPRVGAVHAPGAFFGLVGEVSLWTRALSQGDVRKRMTALQRRTDAGLGIYLDIGSPDFDDGVIPDVSESERPIPGRIAGGVNRLEDYLLYPGAPCPEAQPVLDRQVAGAAVKLEGAKTGRVCVGEVRGLGGSEFAVALWFRADGKQSSRESTLLSYDCGPWAEPQLCIQDCASLSVTMFDAKMVKTARKADDGQWHFLVLSWRSVDGQTVLYLDCQRVWEGKLGQGKTLMEGGSLWIGQGHQWNLPADAMEANIPSSLVPAVANCASKEEALELLAGGGDGEVRWTQEHRLALRPAGYSGGEFGPKQVYDLIMVASMRTHALVGEVAFVSAWSRALQMTDVQQVSSGVLHGEERGLVMVLDAAKFDPETEVIEDWTGHGNRARVSGSYKIAAKQVLRPGLEWEQQSARAGPSAGGGSALQFVGDKSYAILSKFKNMPTSEFSISMWVRSSDLGRRGVLLSYAVGVGDKARELVLHDHTNLAVVIKNKSIATGISLADGAWHHVVVTWTSSSRCQELADEGGKEKRGPGAKTKVASGGELQVLLDGERVVWKGQQGEMAVEAGGTLAVGEELGGVKGDFTAAGSFVGEIAELSIWERRLEKQDVETMFGRVGMLDQAKGLQLHWDFQGDGPVVTDRSGGGWHGKIGGVQGQARMVALQGVYQIRPVPRGPTDEGSPAGVRAKALHFVGRGEGYLELFPFREMPKEEVTVAFWMRTADRSRSGTPLSYAASLQGRISVEFSFNRKTQTVRVDPAMSFEKLVSILAEKFGRELTFEYADLFSDGGGNTVVRTAEQFEELRSTVYELGLETLQVQALECPTKELNMHLRSHRTKSSPTFEGRELIVQHSRPPSEVAPRGASAEEARDLREREAQLQEEQRLRVAVKGKEALRNRRVRLSDGRWHHVAVTWRGTDGRLQVLVDGCVVSEETEHKGGRLHAGGCLVVGQGQVQVGPPFDDGAGFEGHVAEVSVWKRCLAAARVQKLMAQRLSGEEEGLVLLWNFTEDPLGGRREVENAVVNEERDEEREEKGRVKGAHSVRWEDVTLPGNLRERGLGRPQAKQDRIVVAIKGVSQLREELLAGMRGAELFFLHVSFHEQHKVTEHMLLHGGFPVVKELVGSLRHEQVLFVDDLGAKRDRDILAEKLAAEHAELPVRVELCVEKTTRDGQVLTEEVGGGQFDLIDILDSAADFVDKKIPLFAADAGGQRAQLCVLSVDVDALAALRALSVKQDTKKQKLAKAANEFKRTATNYSRTEQGRVALAKVRDKKADLERGDGSTADRRSSDGMSNKSSDWNARGGGSRDGGGGRWSRGDKSSDGGRRQSRESVEVEEDVERLVASERGQLKRRPSAEDGAGKGEAVEGVEPKKMVLLCREGAMGGKAGKLVRLEMGWEVLWDEFQGKIEARFGAGFAAEHTPSSGKAVKVVNQQVFELWHMQVEDDVLSGRGSVTVDAKGEATLQVTIVPVSVTATSTAASGDGAGKSNAAHDRGADPDDNPEEYVFRIDCSQMQKKGGGRMGTVTIRVSPEVVWEDFKSTLVQRFGMEVTVEYKDFDGRWVLVKGYDDFNDCCDLIEEQWDEGGDGSMEMRVSERRREAGELAVEERVGYSRLHVGEARRVNQRKVDAIGEDLFSFKRRLLLGFKRSAVGVAPAEVTKALGKAFKVKDSVREAAERLMLDDALLEVQWEAVRPPPAEYVFRCDCKPLKKAKTGRKGPVTVRTGREVRWEDFLQALVAKFEKGEEVAAGALSVSYEAEHKGQPVWKVIAGDDEFNKCCTLIEKQWEAGGDGSMHMEVRPRKGGDDAASTASTSRRASAIEREAASRQTIRRSKVEKVVWGVDVDSFMDRFRLLSAGEMEVLERLGSPAFVSACLAIFRQRKAISEALSDLGVGRVSAGQWVKTVSELTGLAKELVEPVCQAQQGERTERSDFRALGSELVAADVGGMLRRSKGEWVMRQVLRRRGALRRRLGKLPERGGLMELEVAVKAVAEESGVDTASARRFLCESGAVLVVERETAAKKSKFRDAEAEAVDKVHVAKVGLVCWRRVLDGLGMLHPAEVQLLQHAREKGGQRVRRAVVAKREVVLKGLKAAGADGKEAWEVVDKVCSEQGVECGKALARGLLEQAKVDRKRGRKDVLGLVEGLQWADTERGSLGETAAAIAGRLDTVMGKCREEQAACPGVLLKYGFTQALQAASLPLGEKQKVVEDAAPVNEWGVDYKELFGQRLCVLSERERAGVVLPSDRGGQCATEARLWVQEQAAELMAKLEEEDGEASGQVEAEAAKRVLLGTMPSLAWEAMEGMAAAIVDEVVKWGGEGASAGSVRLEALEAALGAGERVEGVPFWVMGGAERHPERIMERLRQEGGEGSEVAVEAAKKVIAGEVGAMWKAGTEWAVESLLVGAGGGEGQRVNYAELFKFRPMLLRPGAAAEQEAVEQVVMLRDVLATGAVQVDRGHGLVDVDEMEIVAVEALRQYADAAPVRALLLSAERDVGGGLMDPFRFLSRFCALPEKDAAVLQRIASRGQLEALAYMRNSGEEERRRMVRAGSMTRVLREVEADGVDTDLAGMHERLGVGHGGESAMDAKTLLYKYVAKLDVRYAALLPAQPPADAAKSAGDLVGISMARRATSEGRHAKAAKAPAAASAGAPAAGGGGLTRGQQVFKKLLAGMNKRPGLAAFLEAMGAMPATCVPTPLTNHAARFVQPVAPARGGDPPLCFQFSFEAADGVPDPGSKFVPAGRALQVCLFDIFHMRFVGTPRRLPLVVPKDSSKPEQLLQWRPDKGADATLVSAELGGEAQLHLYLELQQECEIRGAAESRQVVSCGYALLALKDLTAAAAGSRWSAASGGAPTGKRELAVSGGTPFIPRAIEKSQLPGGRSLAARLLSFGAAGKGAMTRMVLRLEKPEKQLLQLANSRVLPPNTVCPAVAAVPIAHFHAILAASQRSALDLLFNRSTSAADPVLALFPKVMRDWATMQHFNALWKQRVEKLGSKDRDKPEVMQRLLRECTLAVWPLLQVNRAAEALKTDAQPGGRKGAGGMDKQEAGVKTYMDSLGKAKGAQDMQKVMAGDTKGTAVPLLFQPFRVDEFVE